MLSYVQAIVIGLLQGVTELFPVSSLGHSVLLPAWLGGSWSQLVTQSASQHSEQSPYLAFIVALHVATALALLWFYRRDWVRIIGGLVDVVRTRQVETSAQRLGLLLIIGTIPVGNTGLILERLDHEDAAHFAFLLATPVIFAAGVLKLPSLAGHAGNHIHGQVLVGAITAGLAAYASIRFLTRYFERRTLAPFGIYCLIAGAISIIRFA